LLIIFGEILSRVETWVYYFIPKTS